MTAPGGRDADRAAGLLALRRGEPGALDAFYRDHARAVLAWVIRLGGPRLDAEDVAHEVFETALRRIGEYRGDASPSTWLYAITRRVVANARRKVWVKRVFGLDAAPEPSQSGGAEHLGLRREVQAVLESLSVDHREVLVLLLMEERPAAEVAEMLGVPVGTVYSRAHHARRLFTEAMAALEAEGRGGQVVHLGRRP